MAHAPSGAPDPGTPRPDAPDDHAALVRGPRLAVDVGTVRVGLAASDPDGTLATPVETLARDSRDRPGRLPKDVARIVREARERCAGCVYVGLPRHLSGAESASSHSARAYAGTLAQAVAPIEVRLVDERMSTVSAHQALFASGRSGRRHRDVVDQAAAVVILQYALDAERATGHRPGERVEVDPSLGPAGQGAVGDATDDGGATRT